METLEELSERIRRERRKLEISQKRLATLVHMSQSTIARLESDIAALNPSYETAFRVVETLERLSAMNSKAVILKKTAGDIMHRKIVYVTPDETVAEAIKKVRYYDFPQLPVLDKEMNILGAVSQKRIMAIATQNPDRIGSMRVGQIMGGDLPRVGKETDIGKLKRILEDWDAVLVVEKGRAIGIISIYDVLKLLG